ncbi:hypothetical protein Efla_003139 [Eimeria flavescens]
MATHKSSGISARMELASGSRDSLSRSKEAQPLDNSSVRSKQSTQVSSCAGSRRSSSGHESLASNRISHARSAKQSSGRPYRIWEALPAWTLEFQGLTPIQQDVMQYVANVAEVESPAAKARLMKAWSVYNIPEADFVAIEVYLAKKVPLTIRLDIQNLFPHLLYDPFYRTTFETMVRGTAYLEARREFERVLFNGLYDHPSVLAKDRPKYGVLNMVCNPFSDTRVSCFGSAYFLLKDSLRARTTVATSKENLGANVRRVGTVDRLWHVIETLSPHEITRIHAVATGRRAKATVSPDCKYSEIQIHGMLDIRKDVAAIVVQRQDLQCPSRGPLVEELSKTYLIPILTCEELDELLEDRRWSTVVNQRANMLFQKTMAMNDASFHTTTRW